MVKSLNSSLLLFIKRNSRSFYILLTALFVISNFGSSYAQPEINCLNLEKINFDDWKILSEDISNSRLVLVGETHNVEPNDKIRNSLFMFLNKFHGVKSMLIEAGYSQSYLYNKYLETHDERFLNAMMPKPRSFSEKSIEIWNELYEYNATIPSTQKIQTIGLDFEREPSLSAALHILLGPDTLNLNVKILFKKLGLRLDTIGFVNDNKTYIEWLRKEFEHLGVEKLSNSKIISNIIYNNSFFSSFYMRDFYMVQNFKKYCSKDELYFGQFGTMHTQLDNDKVFAGILNSTESHKNKVLTINLHYENYKYVYGKKVKYSFLNDIGFFDRSIIRKNKRFFSTLTECKNFIYKIEPKNKNLTVLRNKCKYLIYMNGL